MVMISFVVISQHELGGGLRKTMKNFKDCGPLNSDSNPQALEAHNIKHTSPTSSSILRE